MNWFLPLVGLLIALWTRHAGAAGVSYSQLDLSTVRIFTIKGVEKVVTKHPRTGYAFTLGVPLGGHGSGLRVTADGLILTARHVVDGARMIVVKGPGAKEAVPARVIYMDDREDFAFVSVQGSTEAFVPLPATSPGLRVRQTVFAVGYPMGPAADTPQSTRGVVSGATDDGYTLGISVNPGNSGGPLVDEQEKVVGIMVARGPLEKGVQGIGLAIGLDRVLSVLPQIQRRHARAKSELDALPSTIQATARMVGSLVEGQGTVRMLDDARRALMHLERTPFSSELAKSVGGGTADPDVIALSCAYHWDSAVMHRVLQEDGWQSEIVASRRDCRSAAELDPDVSNRSTFVRFVIENANERVPSNHDSGLQSPARKGAAPPGLAGFALGSSVEAISDQCARANFKMSGVKKEGLRCSGAPVSLGYPAVVRMRICGDAVCRIDALEKLEGDDPAAFVHEYDERLKDLQTAYGPPNRHIAKSAPDCSESIEWCLSNKKAELTDDWIWSDGNVETVIRLRLERNDGHTFVRTLLERR